MIIFLIYLKKKIPDWANDSNYINNKIYQQSLHTKNIKKFFGISPIENLDLKIIFNKNDPKYNDRNSSADWKLDNTITNTLKRNNNINDVIHEVNNHNGEHLFTSTKRHLNF